MPLAALLLDLDGTLVDTNGLHTQAWLDVFAARGHAVERTAIARQVGKGGDLLVPDLLGPEVEEAEGDALRQERGERFRTLVREAPGILLPGALDLIAAARARGWRLALCTSSEEEDLAALFAAAGVDLREHMDATTTATDADQSKPAPDVLHAALEALGVGPEEAVLVGDTIYDGEAAARAGVAFVGLATWVWGTDALREAGARAVFAGPADCAARPDEVEKASA